MGGPSSGLPPGSVPILRSFKFGNVFRVQTPTEISHVARLHVDEVESVLDELVERDLVVEVADGKYFLTARGRAVLGRRFDE